MEQKNVSERGIIIAALEKYEKILLCNIDTLRFQINCQIPIEIWQIGQELSNGTQQLLESKKDEWKISFKDVVDYTDVPSHWQGYQIKAFIMKHTSFDEVILFDCDSLFLQNPEMIFHDPNYIKTGTFFFKDYLRHTPKTDDEVVERKKWFHRLMPFQSPYLTKECYYLYDIPTSEQQYWFYQESGMVYLNRKMHPNVVETIYQLNHDHEETYKYVHGDKETFWIACLLNNVPFYMNKYPGINLFPDINKVMTYDVAKFGPALSHIYTEDGGEESMLFFSQKAYPDPEKISGDIVTRQLS